MDSKFENRAVRISTKDLYEDGIVPQQRRQANVKRISSLLSGGSGYSSESLIGVSNSSPDIQAELRDLATKMKNVNFEELKLEEVKEADHALLEES